METSDVLEKELEKCHLTVTKPKQCFYDISEKITDRKTNQTT